MKFSRKTLASSIAASLFTLGVVAPTAYAEISASAGIASTYLWRGLDLGSGTPAISGDLKYSNSGFYTGVWGSSGDTATGTEYDIFAGYGGSFGEFSYDLSLWNYVYPTGPVENDIFDVADAVVSLGYGPVSFAAYIPIGDGSSGDYMYYTLGGSFGAFSVLLGMHQDSAVNGGAAPCPADETSDTCSPIHLNVSYAYNDNLSFTLSQFVADETEDDDLKFVVSYSLPIGD